MKVVGRRKVGLSTPEDTDQLLRTAWAIRGTDKLVPRGLYRFRSFEEADEWMTRMTARTYVRLRSKTIPVASKETLIRTKQTVRPADHMDCDFLRSLLEEEERP